MSRIGILGGAFDPPHSGHVELAREGSRFFDLERLLIRVVADPGHKDVDTDAAVRLGLAELAFGALPGAEISLDAHARTVDSLEALGLDDPLFLLGADEFAAFLEWKQPERVLELARLGVATRPGVPPARLTRVVAALRAPDRVTFFAIEPHDVSSTAIRARARAGESLEGLVPPVVEAEIERLGLYRGV